MTDKILNISIRIADQPRMQLRIPASQEELVRRAEANINELWRKWSAMDDFKDKSSPEILAMVTFRFAQLYFGAMEMSDRVDKTLSGLEKSLDKMLLNSLPTAETRQECLDSSVRRILRLDGVLPPHWKNEFTHAQHSLRLSSHCGMPQAREAGCLAVLFLLYYHILIPYS